jgi:hypothetical protein
MFKPSKEDSERTLGLIKAIFSEKAQNASKYSVAYGYYIKSSFFSKTTFNYIIGFSEADKEIVVIPLDVSEEVKAAGEPIILNKNNIVSIKSGFQGDTVIKANGLATDLRFFVPGFTPPGLENAYVLPVVQTELAVVFRDFVKKGV